MSMEYLIGDKISNYEAARSMVETAEAQLKELKAKRDALEGEVISTLLDIQEQTGAANMKIEYEGRSYSVSQKSYYTIPKQNRDAAFEQMRNLGMGDLIQERVDDRTLTKELEAVAENNGFWEDEYSELLDQLSVYTKGTLRRVKV